MMFILVIILIIVIIVFISMIVTLAGVIKNLYALTKEMSPEATSTNQPDDVEPTETKSRKRQRNIFSFANLMGKGSVTDSIEEYRSPCADGRGYVQDGRCYRTDLGDDDTLTYVDSESSVGPVIVNSCDTKRDIEKLRSTNYFIARKY